MRRHPSAADFPALLTKLCDAGVEFIIVGGAAAVIQGAPNTTSDLEIVHRRSSDNVARLLDVLLSLDATMRHDLANRGLRPTAELLAGTGQINLSTSLGPIDPLCELDVGQGYEELLPHSQLIIDEGRTLRVLDLPTLIAVKAKAGRPKDRMVLPVLIATLQERDK
ncbi:hypothetical protein [Sorangium sp. So ce887]|uniref:hypothetical protein n=1 Tax=Sorangium sp. So ce887 TaxID=3133324 RepID=UPI003F5F3483